MASPETNNFGESDGDTNIDQGEINDTQQTETRVSTHSELKENISASDDDKVIKNDSKISTENTDTAFETAPSGTKKNEAPPPAAVKSALSTAPMRLPPIQVKIQYHMSQQQQIQLCAKRKLRTSQRQQDKGYYCMLSLLYERDHSVT